MNAFAERVRSAAVAGWWTLLIGSLFLTLQWLASQRCYRPSLNGC